MDLSLLKNLENHSSLINELYTNIYKIVRLYDLYIQEIQADPKKKFKTKDYKQSQIQYKSENLIDVVKCHYYSTYKIVEEIKREELDYNDEFNVDKTKKEIKYVVNVAEDEQKQKLFVLFLLAYNLESYLTKKKCYIGIDCEFTQKKISLMQLNFERKNKLKSYMWIIPPGEMNKEMKSYLVKYLFANTQVYKIVNGCDSLDLPYFYEELFEKNNEHLLKFTQKIIDMRFLCEYCKTFINENPIRCNIYDGLLFFETINKPIYDKLNDINEKMQPHHDQVWNIHKISSFHVRYAYYDVLFLKYYIKNVYAWCNEKNIKFGIQLVKQLNKLVILDKYIIVPFIALLKTHIDPINNFFYKKNGQNVNLITVYKEVIDKQNIDSVNLKVSNLFRINYFREHLMYLLKAKVYDHIITHQKVFEKSNKPYNNTVSIIDILNNYLKQTKFNYIKTFLNLLIIST